MIEQIPWIHFWSMTKKKHNKNGLHTYTFEHFKVPACFFFFLFLPKFVRKHFYEYRRQVVLRYLLANVRYDACEKKNSRVPCRGHCENSIIMLYLFTRGYKKKKKIREKKTHGYYFITVLEVPFKVHSRWPWKGSARTNNESVITRDNTKVMSLFTPVIVRRAACHGRWSNNDRGIYIIILMDG